MWLLRGCFTFFARLSISSKTENQPFSPHHHNILIFCITGTLSSRRLTCGASLTPWRSRWRRTLRAGATGKKRCDPYDYLNHHHHHPHLHHQEEEDDEGALERPTGRQSKGPHPESLCEMCKVGFSGGMCEM